MTEIITSSLASRVARKIVDSSKVSYPKSWARIANSSIDKKYSFVVTLHTVYGVPYGTEVSETLKTLVALESGMSREMYDKLMRDWILSWTDFPELEPMED